MREITIIEMNAVSGGSPAEIAFGFIAGAISTALVYSVTQSSGQCKTLYEQHSFYYDVTTPVYDALGIYQGDVVDTYQDFKYVPVTVCV